VLSGLKEKKEVLPSIYIYKILEKYGDDPFEDIRDGVMNIFFAVCS